MVRSPWVVNGLGAARSRTTTCRIAVITTDLEQCVVRDRPIKIANKKSTLAAASFPHVLGKAPYFRRGRQGPR